MLSAANLLPLKFAPISLEYVNDKFVQFFPQITNWRNETSSEESTFTFETTPYTPLNDRLGGSVKQDSRAVMLVKADKPLYLRGSVKNTYSSHNWYSTNKNFDLLDSSGHIPTTENHNITNERVSIEVYPINIKTTTVFSPFRSIEIVIDAKKVKYNSDFEMFIDRSFFQPLPDHYQITSEIPVIKEGLPGYLHDPEDFRDYLQLPETLPKRVKNLAHEISSLHKNDYHKMKALEHYLRKNYTYSLSVSTPPVDRDFVDFFLFDEKSGYCTYYATSLAVMGRSIGIPTRYVEGFILPSYRNADGLYEVTANNAHAWVEAYFNDLGWITFEPTPAYPSQYHEYQPTESISDEQPYQIATGVSDRELPGGYLQFKDRLLEDGYQTQDIHDENRFVVNKENNQRLWPITAAIIGLALLLRILYCRQRNKKVFVVSGQKEKAAVYYHCILHLFSYMKPLNPKSCTPSEALHYIIDVLPLDEYDDYLIMVFEKALYSEEWISEEDDRLMAYFLQDMENVVKSKLGHIRFFTAKYFHGNLYPINIRAI
ncbi:MAG: transglutaminase-like domain-containing protein [Bacillota bacterium]